MPEGYKVGLWQILKSAIGKDITKISMPVELNEPISFLQRAAEQNEYEHLIREASHEPNSLKRLALLAIYSITTYANVEGRSRKPFNPILGETYELFTPNFKFFAEQVSHHPPVCAFHIEGQNYI